MGAGGSLFPCFYRRGMEYEKFPIGKLENSVTFFASKFGCFRCVQYHPNDYANFCQLYQLGWIE